MLSGDMLIGLDLEAGSINFGANGYYITVMTEDQEDMALIFFMGDQSPRKKFPIIVKTLEDSLGLRKLFDSAENE